MKHIIYIGIAVMMAASYGNAHVAASLGADNPTVSDYSLTETAKAIDKRQFRIDATELYDRKGNVKVAVNSYIEIDGTDVKLSLAPQDGRTSRLDLLHIEDENAEISNVKTGRKGKMTFSIRICRDENLKDTEIRVTVFSGSDICHADVYSAYGGNFSYRLRGTIAPLH